MIIFRADANEHTGTGHIMRCLAIAAEFAERGEKIIFATADTKSHEIIKRRGFNTFCLDSNYTDMEAELSAMNLIIKDYNPSLVVIDSYYVTEKYFHGLSGKTRTAYIDDLNAECWDVDFLVNYNIYSSLYDYSSYSKRTKLLLGPEYVPLRKEFQNLPEHAVNEKIEAILISAGGSDPENVTEKIINDVCINWPGVKFHFVVGAMNPAASRLKELSGKNIVLHIDERNMSRLMMSCDIAVSAAGSTLYELCACGTPAITYVLADNQTAGANCFAARGIMLNAGDCRGDREFTARINRNIEALARDSQHRKNLSRKMQKLIDGKGAARLAEALTAK